MRTPQIPAQWSQHGQIEEVKPAAPANWYTSSMAEDLQGLIYNEKTGQSIAVCYNPAHAALIAAAPELLKACELALKDTEMLLSGECDPTDDNYNATISVLMDAIRKASG
jgi:hypothetical protein